MLLLRWCKLVVELSGKFVVGPDAVFGQEHCDMSAEADWNTAGAVHCDMRRRLGGVPAVQEFAGV